MHRFYPWLQGGADNFREFRSGGSSEIFGLLVEGLSYRWASKSKRGACDFGTFCKYVTDRLKKQILILLFHGSIGFPDNIGCEKKVCIIGNTSLEANLCVQYPIKSPVRVRGMWRKSMIELAKFVSIGGPGASGVLRKCY